VIADPVAVTGIPLVLPDDLLERVPPNDRGTVIDNLLLVRSKRPQHSCQQIKFSSFVRNPFRVRGAKKSKVFVAHRLRLNHVVIRFGKAHWGQISGWQVSGWQIPTARRD
jgi:hypothetical protein